MTYTGRMHQGAYQELEVGAYQSQATGIREGVGALELGAFSVVGAGTFTSTYKIGTGVLVLGSFSAVGAGTFLTTTVTAADSDLVLGSFSVSGAGSFSATTVTAASSALTLATFSVVGEGTYTAPTVNGGGALSLGIFSVSGVGNIWHQEALIAVPARGGAEILTYADAVFHLATAADSSLQEAENRRFRTAILAAYRRLTSATKWKYYHEIRRLNLDAPYNTGTVTYSTATRALTLAGGTWPTWAGSGHVVLGTAQQVYTIASRDSDTVLTLSAHRCPTSTVSTGIGYLLYRAMYSLPADTGHLGPFFELNTAGACYVPPEEWLRMERMLGNVGGPFRWTVMGDPSYFSRMAVFLDGYPTEAATFDYLAIRSPRQLRYDGIQAASRMNVLHTAGSTAVMSVNKPFVGAMVGCVIRISTDAVNLPTGWADTNPYREQKVLTAVGSNETAAYTATVDSAWETTTPSTLTAKGVLASVTDVVDVPELAINAFLACCRVSFSRMNQEGGEAEAAELDYQRELIMAMSLNGSFGNTEDMVNERQLFGPGPAVSRPRISW